MIPNAPKLPKKHSEKLIATIYFKSGNSVKITVTRCEIVVNQLGVKELHVEPVDLINWMFDVNQIECITTRKPIF